MGSIIAVGTAVIDTVLVSEEVLDNGKCNKVLRTSADGGAIRNVAHNLALLGDDVLFWAKFGNDCEALDMISRLETSGVQVFSKMLNFPSPHFYQIFDNASSMMISSMSNIFYFNEWDLLPNFLVNAGKIGITDQDDAGFLKKLTSRSPEVRWIAMGFLPPYELKDHFCAVFVNQDEALRNAGSTDAFLTKASAIGLVVVTLDKEGLIYINKGERHNLEAPVLGKGNTLGMGDALVAGFIHGLNDGLAIEEGLQIGVACAQKTSEVSTSVNLDLAK
jgi:sugar/nucleoside kinase (ribokinase family)